MGGNSTLYISDQPNFDASTISPSGDLNPSATVASGFPAGTFGLAATGPVGFGFRGALPAVSNRRRLVDS
jgi:hypothetical protein